jgi:hypothetical protein
MTSAIAAADTRDRDQRLLRLEYVGEDLRVR